MKTTRVKNLALLAGLLVTALFSTHCTFRTPAKETPTPSIQKFPKAFFLKNVSVSGADSLPEKVTSKTFLCGWASENEVGSYAESNLLHNYNQAWGCNIQFEITEKYVVGRLIDPYYIDNPNKWKEVLRIPIKSHYYTEPEKDGYGRDTNREVDNSSRSDWSRRPFVELDLAGIQITNWAFALLDGDGARVSHISDKVQDLDNGYLSFTVHTIGDYLKSENQADYRFSFKSFESDPSFERGYFPAHNAAYINPVFTIGMIAENRDATYYLAHWDLSKSHDMYLVNFPNQDMTNAALEVLEAYNEELTKIVKPGYKDGGKNIFPFFKGIPVQRKHPFDLRENSITWISDRRISAHSPLGVAYANPDLRTGKIMWGGLTVWGGELENYLKRYSPATVFAKSAGAASRFSVIKGDPTFPTSDSILGQEVADLSGFNWQILDPSSLFFEFLPDSLRQGLEKIGLLNNMTVPSFLNTSDSTLNDRVVGLNGMSDEKILADVEMFKSQLSDYKGEQNQLRENLGKIVGRELSRLHTESLKIPSGMASVYDRFNFPRAASESDLVNAFGTNHKELNFEQRVASLTGSIERDGETVSFEQRAVEHFNGMVHDADRTFSESARQWAEGMMERAANDPDFDEHATFRIIVKALISHEFGHVLGLGHNFKGNLLPSEKAVPKNLYAAMKEKTTAGRYSALSTSIMEYPSGHSEMYYSDEDTRPQIQDVQMLNYIYGNRYPVGIGANEYIYKDLPHNREIPEDNKFLPQCGDFRASIGDDPFCSRWDSGADARSIVAGRLESLKNNLIYTLFAFNESRGGSSSLHEYILWFRSMTEASRLRTFYDYMRIQLEEKAPSFMKKLYWDRDGLQKFSSACSDSRAADEVIPQYLSDFFKNPENAEIKELCQLNKKIIEEFTALLTRDGLDYTDRSWAGDKQYVLWSNSQSVGSDTSHILGTWNQLSMFPLKFSLLMNMTTATPYTFWGPWLLPIPQYSDVKARFLMNTLYPMEFNSSLASIVNANIHTTLDEGQGFTNIGLPVLALGSMLGNMRSSNDALRLPDDYTDLLRKQTQFEFSPGQDVVAIIMTGKPREGEDKQLITDFDTKLYDFRAGGWAERNMKPAYLLEHSKVIIQPPPNTFILPVGDFQWANSTTGVVIALRIKTSDDNKDNLTKKSVRFNLNEKNQNIIDACVIGDADKQNGLQDFFVGRSDNGVPGQFPGFKVGAHIATDINAQSEFYDSVTNMFHNYHTFYPPARAVDPDICPETLKGVTLTATTALVINGWWLPQTLDKYLKSGR